MTTSQSQYNIYQQLTSARVVDEANLAGVYLNGPVNNGVGATLTAASPAALTIDSVALANGDRVLLTAQTSAFQNGVYIVISAGSGSSVWQLQRSGDFQNIEQLKGGQFIPISAGSSHAGTMWVLVEPLPAHLGIDSITFAQV